jgi:hypothetical protein
MPDTEALESVQRARYRAAFRAAAALVCLLYRCQTMLRRWAGVVAKEGLHTIISPVGLCGGGVLLRAVAKDGTSTSPRISPPSPLDFLLR